MLFDTNALLLPFRERLPVLEELQRLLPGARILLPSPVVGELRRLAQRRAAHAAVALAWAQRFPIRPARGRGDRGVLELARATGAIVVTADRAFARRLALAGVPVLGPRGRTRLAWRWPDRVGPILVDDAPDSAGSVKTRTPVRRRTGGRIHERRGPAPPESGARVR